MSTSGTDDRFRFPLYRLFLVLLLYALAFGFFGHQGAVGIAIAAVLGTVISGFVLIGRAWGLLCLVGGFLLLWPYADDRSLYWHRRHLEMIDYQLQGLKDLLRDHKNTYGRYPSNDEGLAALENFDSRFTLSYHRTLHEARWMDSSGFIGDGSSRSWWQKSRASLKRFRDRHGRAPRDRRDFFQTEIGYAFRDKERMGELEQRPTEVEFAIDRHDNIFLHDSAGVLSPWLLPYNYENRNGVHADAFCGSPADGDRWGCSVLVDNGVYVFSSGGYVYAQEFRRMWWQRNGPRMLGVSLITIGIVMAIHGVVRTRYRRPLLGLLAVIPGFLCGGGLSVMNRATCYVMSELFSHRSPKMVAVQMKLLDKYRDTGVISEDTYQRAVSATRREKPAPGSQTENRQ